MTKPNNERTNARTRHPPQPLIQFREMVRRAGVGWLGRGTDAFLVCIFRGRLADSYAAGVTRVLPMSTWSTRRGRGILSLSNAMGCGGVGVLRGVSARVVPSFGASSFAGSMGVSGCVSASESSNFLILFARSSSFVIMSLKPFSASTKVQVVHKGFLVFSLVSFVF